MKLKRHTAGHTAVSLACACIAAAFTSISQAAPVALPDPGIKGYKFPESKATLMDWINKGQAKHVQLHGWGLWTALNMPSGQSEFGMKNVPVYLTWLSPSEIAAIPQGGVKPMMAIEAKRLFKLEKPRQFSHGRINAMVEAAPAASTAPGSAPGTASVPADTGIFVTMGYDPAAASFAHGNDLFSMAALKAIYDKGVGDIRSIPTFPIDAVVAKPTYKVITKANLINGRFYKMPAWPGPPGVITPTITANGFPESSWPDCVYVDTKNLGMSNAKGVDNNCKQGPVRANTYGLGDFVSYPITSDNIANFDTLLGSKTLAVGDVVLLMAMHVTSREIDEWTWQTYFWTPNPAKPALPSTAAIARVRPTKLIGAAAHYAMSIGYQMVAPNQPISGGHSVGSPVTVYNPYLESEFGATVFGTPPVNQGIQKQGAAKPYMATVGVQSNCMTCHGNATVSPTDASKSLPYLTDFYVSRDNPAFKGYLQLDFLWSIQGTAK